MAVFVLGEDMEDMEDVLKRKKKKRAFCLECGLC